MSSHLIFDLLGFPTPRPEPRSRVLTGDCIELMRRMPEKSVQCILAGSRLDDLVLDPFTGSGTTGEVAVQHELRFIGTELNPDYVKLAEERISKA